MVLVLVSEVIEVLVVVESENSEEVEAAEDANADFGKWESIKAVCSSLVDEDSERVE